jgi:hypothetical protein
LLVAQRGERELHVAPARPPPHRRRPGAEELDVEY